MTLREQIHEIAAQRINSVYADHVAFPMVVTALAAQAFIEQWTESVDTRAVRKASQLLSSPGWVSDEEEGVLEPQVGDLCGKCNEPLSQWEVDRCLLRHEGCLDAIMVYAQEEP
jgi:hypothetical protein